MEVSGHEQLAPLLLGLNEAVHDGGRVWQIKATQLRAMSHNTHQGAWSPAIWRPPTDTTAYRLHLPVALPRTKPWPHGTWGTLILQTIAVDILCLSASFLNLKVSYWNSSSCLSFCENKKNINYHINIPIFFMWVYCVALCGKFLLMRVSQNTKATRNRSHYIYMCIRAKPFLWKKSRIITSISCRSTSPCRKFYLCDTRPSHDASTQFDFEKSVFPQF